MKFFKAQFKVVQLREDEFDIYKRYAFYGWKYITSRNSIEKAEEKIKILSLSPVFYNGSGDRLG